MEIDEKAKEAFLYRLLMDQGGTEVSRDFPELTYLRLLKHFFGDRKKLEAQGLRAQYKAIISVINEKELWPIVAFYACALENDNPIGSLLITRYTTASGIINNLTVHSVSKGILENAAIPSMNMYFLSKFQERRNPFPFEFASKPLDLNLFCPIIRKNKHFASSAKRQKEIHNWLDKQDDL